jgi:hypothetical protein
MALLAAACTQVPHWRHRSLNQKTLNPDLSVSGFAHHWQRKLHCCINTVLRSPGPSLVE